MGVFVGILSGKRPVSGYWRSAQQEPMRKVVPRARLERARAFAHYPLKIACLPISPPRLERKDCRRDGAWAAPLRVRSNGAHP